MMTDDKNTLQEQLEIFLQKQALNIHRLYNPAYLSRNLRMPVLDKIAIHFGKLSGVSISDLIIRARNYVHIARGSGAEVRYTDSYKTPTQHVPHILQAIWRYHEGKSKIGVDMFCQGAMLALGAILQSFGITSREISILSVTSDNTNQRINSHAVLEVWNEEENRWELHDPIGDIVYAVRCEGGGGGPPPCLGE